MMSRVLLLLPTGTYRTHDFMEAAGKLGVEVVVASEEASTMERLQPGSLLTLDFLDPDAAARRAAAFHRVHPFVAVIPVDEETAVVAAAIAQAVGLPHNAPEAARATRFKHAMRDLLARAGISGPRHELCSLEDDPTALAKRVSYPSVLKPVFLSASRGVIRVDDENEFVHAFHRIKAIVEKPEVARRGASLAGKVLVEDYIPGTEVALEGLLTNGDLKVLALFDKPGLLEGPFFEETFYVTPSRLTERLQWEIIATTRRASEALGLRHGAVHAELRINDQGVFVVEVAARSIGGLCSRALRFGLGHSLEELLVRHALGMDVGSLSRESKAAGVMMIPIPEAGILEEVSGIEQAKAVRGIEGVILTAHPGKRLVPLPEGASYLGFIFARADETESVEGALREAHRRLKFCINPSPRPPWKPVE
ncbi:MAG: ATP-grasp domain-containing protein [Acidobacteriota bacterium]